MDGAFRYSAILVLAASITMASIGYAHALSHGPSEYVPETFQANDGLAVLGDVGGTFRVVDTLAVNTDTTYHLAIPNKCQAVGEAELSRLAAVSTVEESYVFVPSLCLWIETGLNERQHSVKPDAAIIERLLARFPTLAIYHVHVGSPQTLEAYFPAYMDLLGTVLINTPYHGVDDVDIRHRAVTSKGTIEYAFVPSPAVALLEKKLTSTGLSGYAAQNIAYELSASRHRDAYYAVVAACRTEAANSPENIERCFPMQTGNFLLTFHHSNTSGTVDQVSSARHK